MSPQLGCDRLNRPGFCLFGVPSASSPSLCALDHLVPCTKELMIASVCFPPLRWGRNLQVFLLSGACPRDLVRKLASSIWSLFGPGFGNSMGNCVRLRVVVVCRVTGSPVLPATSNVGRPTQSPRKRKAPAGARGRPFSE